MVPFGSCIDKIRRHNRYIKFLLEIRRGTIVPLLSQATGYSGIVLADTPHRCVVIDWTFRSKVLQLRANFSQHSVALPATADNRVYPTGDIPEAGLGPATCQAFIRQSQSSEGDKLPKKTGPTWKPIRIPRNLRPRR